MVDAFDPDSNTSFHQSNCARVWLLFNGRDFDCVCNLADRDPEAVRERARKIDKDVKTRARREILRARAFADDEPLKRNARKGENSKKKNELRKHRILLEPETRAYGNS
jgi:beta-glucosidase-like glycosyl hydrolase